MYWFIFFLGFVVFPVRANSVVAYVNGKELFYEDVRVGNDQAVLTFKILRGHQPISQSELLDTEQIRQDLEIQRLASKIKDIVLERILAEHQIVATEAEIVDKWELLTKNYDYESVKNEKLRPLAQALKEVYDKSRDKDSVYKELLSDMMTPAEWEAYVSYFRGSDRRKELEKSLSLSIDQLDRRGARAMVIEEKLNKVIDEEITRDDPYVASLQKESGAERNGKLAAYLGKRRAEWWRHQYNNSRILIVDQRFQRVLDILTLHTTEKSNGDSN